MKQSLTESGILLSVSNEQLICSKMFKVLDYTTNDIIAILVEGKITKADYEKLNPLIDKKINEFGKIKFFIQMNDMEAITPEAIVSDVRMYLNHYAHIRKAAVLGDKTWQRIIAGIANPFILGKIKYFPKNETGQALQWINE